MESDSAFLRRIAKLIHNRQDMERLLEMAQRIDWNEQAKTEPPQQ